MSSLNFKSVIYPLLLLSFIACYNNTTKESYLSNILELTSKEENDIDILVGDYQYKIIGIKDGDTFVILNDGKELVIRLEHIDCPEKKQPFGQNAKQFASDLCFNRNVTLLHNNKFDRNNRLIAEVILENGINVNKELVKHGLAWHFKKYSSNTEYAELEEIARTNHIGIWSESNPIAPWDWRNK